MMAASRSPRADEAQRDSLVLPLDHRVQRDGGADAGEGDDHIEEAADEDGGVRSRADDVVRIVQHRAVQEQGRDRDEGDQVEHARDERGLPQGVHRNSFRRGLFMPWFGRWWPCRSPWLVGWSRIGELAGVDGGYVGLVGVDLGDRDQRQAYVAHLLEQAVQSGLVDDEAGDDGGAVAVVGQAQPVEPGGPAGIEVPLEADFVPSGLVRRSMCRSSCSFRCCRPGRISARLRIPSA